MHPTTIATAFVTVFVAELPDKTMLATVVLSARFRRPLPVWLGAACALTLQMVIASAAGALLAQLPERPVRLAVATLFAVGAVVLWCSRDDVDHVPDEDDDDRRPLPAWRVSTTVFGVVFLAEWGDLTQLATASLAAGGRALSVFVGAAAAMVTVAAIGVLAGRALLRVLPERLLRRAAAGVFALLAVVAAVSAA
ncbi:MAG: TMEM165/GDT1 family protein [Actinomycetota bacterium]|nr:TMEM165/GDT1 family protein [Actinomycetota bacterium]